MIDLHKFLYWLYELHFSSLFIWQHVQEKWSPVIKHSKKSITSTIAPHIQIAKSKLAEGYELAVEFVSPYLEKIHDAIKPHLEVYSLNLLLCRSSLQCTYFFVNLHYGVEIHVLLCICWVSDYWNDNDA